MGFYPEYEKPPGPTKTKPKQIVKQAKHVIRKFYCRRPQIVEAAQVWLDNMVAAAKWCGGKAIKTYDGKLFAGVELKNSGGFTVMAYIGDHIVKSFGTFDVWHHDEFTKSFKETEPQE